MIVRGASWLFLDRDVAIGFTWGWLLVRGSYREIRTSVPREAPPFLSDLLGRSSYNQLPAIHLSYVAGGNVVRVMISFGTICTLSASYRD